MKAKVLGSLAFGLLGVCAASQVSAVTLSPGTSEVFFNWDIQPFDGNSTIFLLLQSPDGAAGDAMHIRVFNGLNGSGSIITSGDAPATGIGVITMGFGDTDGDGAFSVGLQSFAGTFDVNPCAEVSASGSPTDAGACLAPISSSVPEPGTLALLGFGLAGLGFTRQRKAD